MSTPTTSPRAVHSTWSATLRIVVGASVLVALVLLAFAWPTHTAKVKDMPLAVAGAPQAVAAVEKQLATAAEGAFSIHEVTDRAAAEEMVKKREAYGAIVLPSAPGGQTEVLTASAGSAVVTQALGQMAAGMNAAQAQAAQAQAAASGTAPAVVVPVKITDIVPLVKDDARGQGFMLIGLPMAMGGMIGGVLIAMTITGSRRRLAAIAGYAVLAGLLLTLVVHTWFGWLPANFMASWGAMALTLAATASAIVGLHALIGRAGIAVGAILTMFVGNPLSSLAMPKEWLPSFWGELGQFFVPGASGNLLRS
ncbi:MAG TPA: ABC transporter permease, partial [Phycicoccus sp.]|nr:ABC transporter permease [Phycicoccus sp.]